MIHEGKEVGSIELPRCVQVEPVGRRMLPRRMTALSMRVDGLRGGPPALLSFDAFLRILDELPDLEELRLQGEGEPLSHPRFFDMVRAAARRGIAVSTTSTLQVFNRRLAEECVRSGLRALHVPLDRAGTRDYDFSRRGARHERMLRHLRWLTEARRVQGSQTPHITLTAVLMRRNLEGLAEAVRLAHDHGADGVAARSLRDFADGVPASAGNGRIGRFVESETLTATDAPAVERCVAQARALAQELGVGLQIPPAPVAERTRVACPWPWNATCIDFSGEARSCDLAARASGQAFGNVLKDGFATVWRSDSYRKFRERHLGGDLEGLCAHCPRIHSPAS
ncbi:MAG: SPASM domain-containing protein [Clostridia bacterium]